METMTLRIFQREIERQCRFAIIAAGELTEGLTNDNQDLAWYAMQNLLIAIGNVSKIFWPSKEFKNRGEELRENLGVEDDCPLRPRGLRDSFEHFDERLEKWAKSSERHNFIDSNIAGPNDIAGVDVKDYLRNFDPSSWTLTFRGDEYELRPPIEAIQNLYPRVSTEANKPWWE